MLPKTVAEKVRAQGWAVMPRYADPAGLAAVAAEATAIADAPGLHSACQYFLDRFADGSTRLARIERVADALPALGATGLLARMAGDARHLLGGPVVLFKDKLNIRYPGSPGYAPHQDAARWQVHAADFLSFGLFLSASDPDRGGFRFARFDLSEGVLPSQSGDFDAIRFAALPQTDVVARAGDAIAISGSAPHSTGENRSAERLLHLLITFARSDDPGVRDAYYAAQSRSFAQVRTGNSFTFARR